ncbi:unnamed protein product [Protopolystoma xenopodis]|uniref:Uncharacterized protein n=1 Tax=Protopolystoma xenopodis TaxID=117903 RepID=A0A448X0U6_9PLAT|nr:unnamed protein product [Protopolystoma xenopodis]
MSNVVIILRFCYEFYAISLLRDAKIKKSQAASLFFKKTSLLHHPNHHANQTILPPANHHHTPYPPLTPVAPGMHYASIATSSSISAVSNNSLTSSGGGSQGGGGALSIPDIYPSGAGLITNPMGFSSSGAGLGTVVASGLYPGLAAKSQSPSSYHLHLHHSHAHSNNHQHHHIQHSNHYTHHHQINYQSQHSLLLPHHNHSHLGLLLNSSGTNNALLGHKKSVPAHLAASGGGATGFGASGFANSAWGSTAAGTAVSGSVCSNNNSGVVTGTNPSGSYLAGLFAARQGGEGRNTPAILSMNSLGVQSSGHTTSSSSMAMATSTGTLATVPTGPITSNDDQFMLPELKGSERKYSVHCSL